MKSGNFQTIHNNYLTFFVILLKKYKIRFLKTTYFIHNVANTDIIQDSFKLLSLSYKTNGYLALEAP